MNSIPAKPRLLGLDLFRAIAVFGMLVAHVGPAAWIPDGGLGRFVWQWEIFHSRMPAMFAVAAGLSLNLSSRVKPGVVQSQGPAIPIKPLLIRSAALLLIGLVLMALQTPAAVILPYFAIWFILLILPLRLTTREMFWLAGSWAVFGPILSFGLRLLVSNSRTNPLWLVLVTGDYPAATWLPFVFLGVAIGRLDLSLPRVRRWLLAVGSGIAVLAYGASNLFLALGGRELIAQRVPGGTLANYAQLFHQETGITSLTSWLWLFTDAPHSGSLADVWGCIGFAMACLAILLWLGDWAAATSRNWGARIVQLTLRAVATTGAMVLSVYVAHIVAMWAITQLTGHSFVPAQSVWMLAGFTIALVVGCSLWASRFRRGPLEAGLAKLTSWALKSRR